MATCAAYRMTMNDLEALVDSTSVATVIEALADVCRDKADHLQGNWQDNASAIEWNLIAGQLSQVARQALKL